MLHNGAPDRWSAQRWGIGDAARGKVRSRTGFQPAQSWPSGCMQNGYLLMRANGTNLALATAGRGFLGAVQPRWCKS
jgi:hypothetical protein